LTSAGTAATAAGSGLTWIVCCPVSGPIVIDWTPPADPPEPAADPADEDVVELDRDEQAVSVVARASTDAAVTMQRRRMDVDMGSRFLLGAGVKPTRVVGMGDADDGLPDPEQVRQRV